MNVEHLIELVRAQSVLYDVRHSKYSDKSVKYLIWKDIGRQLDQPALTCKKHWTNLRDSFRRALKKKQYLPSDSKARLWRFEEEMAFLVPHFQERQQSYLNFDEPNLKEETSTFSEETFADAQFESPDEAEIAENGGTERIFAEKLKTKKPSTKRKNDSSDSENESSAAALVKCLKKIKNSQTPEDSLSSFFSSIYATVKTFTPYHQTVAKSKIFAVVSELEIDQVQKIDNTST